MELFTKIFQWFVYSSANPSQLSLTLKGLIPLLGLLGIEQVLSEEVIDGIVGVIVQFGTIVTAAIAALGFVRKIVFSVNPQE